MAHVKSIDIWYNNADRPKNTIKVTIAMKPAGDCTIDCAVPPDFYDCLVTIAQQAADLHEQKMRAQILADTTKETAGV